MPENPLHIIWQTIMGSQMQLPTSISIYSKTKRNVLINVLTYKGIESDANIINQAGKLRSISYSMAQLSNQLNNEDNYRNHESLTSK